MKILIIDDERSIRNSLKEILVDEGYDVDVAENGAQGCEMVDKEKYSVIFCDIKMPEMDGMEVLDRLAAMGVEAAVVMISGHGDIQTAVECIKKGAFDFIQKPLDLNRILIIVGAGFQRNQGCAFSLAQQTDFIHHGYIDVIGQLRLVKRLALHLAQNLLITAGGQLYRQKQAGHYQESHSRNAYYIFY